MEVIIQSMGFKASEELKALIQEKLDKLDEKTDKVIRADVGLYQGSDGNPENNYCEIRLEMPGNDPFVKKHAASFEQSVTDAVDTLQTILRKNKEKLQDYRQASA